jgi:4-amino-4-deoxy-L-arabinose transferase-like glycosyltransferase
MSSTVTMPPASVDIPNERPVRGWSPLWSRLSLGGIILVSIFMNFYQLGQNGYGNSYYAAGVKSMGDSLHNFFFVAFDPGAFVTIDKPPLGFWLQVISTKVFGFTAFSIFLPQALAGVISVWLLYILVKRHFGITAGLIAAFALAASPISVVTNRNNTIDSTLTLIMLLGAWAVMKAAESGKLRWLIMTAVLVGIGFNVKMMEAYLVVPAYGLLYVMAAPRKLWTRIWHLAVAVVIMVVISFSWALVVDLIPSVLRPYVGSTQNNSEISLAIGYNGVSRLLGNSTGGGGAVGGGGGGAGSFGTGIPGVLRLFEAQLGSQIAWLLPFALLALVALAWQRKWRFREDQQQQAMLLWGGWLLTMGVFFSVAGFFHQYYLTVMAPSICALFGIGVVVMWNDYRRRGWRGWLLPIALILTAAEQIYIISAEPAWGTWLIPVIAVMCSVAALTLLIARLVPGLVRPRRGPGLLKAAVVVGLIGLMLTPFIWSAAPGVQNVAQNLPSAGPSGEGGFGGGSQSNTTDAALIKYLEVNQGGTKYLVATSSSNSADAIILETNKPVMALGGFSGSDPILTTAQLQALIKNGTVRYFLLGSSGGGGTGARAGGFNINDLPARIREQINAQGGNGGPPTGGFGGGTGGGASSQGTLTSWVTQNCKVVSVSGSGSSTQGGSQLYDCVAAR